MRARPVLVLLLALPLAAACAQTREAATTSTTVSASGSACGPLLAVEEVAALFGETAFLDADTSESVEGVNCVWTTHAASPGAPRQVLQIQLYEGEEYYVADQFEDAQPVAGIGDEAFYSAELGVTVGFRDGATVVEMTYSVFGEGAFDPATRKDQVVELLRRVHDRVT